MRLTLPFVCVVALFLAGLGGQDAYAQRSAHRATDALTGIEPAREGGTSIETGPGVQTSIVTHQDLTRSVISANLEQVLDNALPNERVSVIIAFRQNRSVREFRSGGRAERHQNMVRALRAESDNTERVWRSRLALEGARRQRRIWVRNALAVELPVSAVRRMARSAEVTRIDYDAVLAAPITTYASTQTPEWNLDVVGAPILWDIGVAGAGALVANLDTGVDVGHADLAARWRGGAGGWYDPHAEHATPYDADGHGTQTMGIMVAGDATGTSVGMAPDAQWMAAKIFNDAGVAQVSDIELALQWLLDPDGDPATDDLPDVVNNSWVFDNGVDACDPIFQTHFDTLRAAGVAVVFSAGNAGPSAATSISPANTPGVVAVGSVDDDLNLTVSSFSSRGPSSCDAATPFPTVVAPGRGIKTTDLTFGFLPESFNFVTGNFVLCAACCRRNCTIAGRIPEPAAR